MYFVVKILLAPDIKKINIADHEANLVFLGKEPQFLFLYFHIKKPIDTEHFKSVH